ncbi:MAG: NAD(P)H-hydrate dehydratase [Candidatus Binatia bacterium]|nr:NAD(P)H-hydrate dehydratase [Candidatus Binatia bacterium]
MRLVTSEQMRRLDARTIALGTPSLELMERAGQGVADRLHRRSAAACNRGVLVVVGAGNNGGDGFVIARRLATRGYRVRVALLTDASRIAGDAKANLDRWRRRRGRTLELGKGRSTTVRLELSAAVAASGLIVDCVLGTGLRRPVQGAMAEAFDAINAREAKRGRRAPVVAVDLPSGLDGDRGVPLGTAVRADLTYTLGATKLGLVLPVARPWVGELELVEIGLAEEAFDEEAPLPVGSDTTSMRALLPRRVADGHKGTHGHLLLVAGAVGTSGAAVLAGRSALRAGAGLVTIACPSAVQPLIAACLPEVMTSAVEDRFSVAQWTERLAGKKALVIGPGLGTTPSVARLVSSLVKRARVPMVLDADGLNALADRPEVLRKARAPVVLTPHPGEMSRLVGASIEEVQAERRRTALDLAKRTGAVVVLKGSGTLVAAPDGRVGVNLNGGPILGTAGTGDVLAGLIGSLLGQGVDAFDAARLGVFLHGLAGDRLARRFGSAGLLASELADELPPAREELHRSDSAASA